jgi:hypothetical protein
MDWTTTVDKVAHLVNKYDSTVLVDSTGVGSAILDQLRPLIKNRIIGYTFTNESKATLIEKLMIAIERRKIHIPGSIKELQQELRSFGSTKTKSGLMSYGATGSNHDDAVCSLALANYAREQYGASNYISHN